MSVDITNLTSSLSKGPVWIKFTKKDGTERVGSFTTNASSIPAEKQPVGTSTRKVSTTSTRVFDLEKQEWRSFSNDSVIDWSVI